LQLQRRYGNRYVQRVVSEIQDESAEAETAPAAEQTPVPADQTETSAAQTDQSSNTEISMPQIVGQGEPAEVSVEGGCDGLSLHGTTNATFDGGRFSVANQIVKPGTGCTCPEGVPCLHVTGTLVTTYSASVTINMPPVPSGLTACERAHVQSFLQNVLLPHELDHKRRFLTYNGQTRNPIDITDCGQDAIASRVSAIQSAENSARQAAANALSAAIDPFVRPIDCSDCEKATGTSGAGPGSIPDAGASPPAAGAEGNNS
jgi:hypothetical protein